MKIKKFSPSGKKPEERDGDGKSKRRNDPERVNRTVYLTVATLLIILAVAVALTSAAARAAGRAPRLRETQRLSPMKRRIP